MAHRSFAVVLVGLCAATCKSLCDSDPMRLLNGQIQVLRFRPD